ncbi:MAG TPA: DUF305 domain-containing protein [Pseudonocardia sp.]|jgi:uncharacterized protein (DUF305 family)|nr:DUF305 domain-containing protein [Pseudonocardia sp.]
MKNQNVLATALALTTSVLLAGCAAGPGAAPNGPDQQAVAGQPGSTQHNPADVSFATGMIPHHRQAVQMADMVVGRGASAQVTALAGAIKAAQQPEIDRMTSMLKSWNAPVPMDGHQPSNMPDMPMDGHDMPGMAASGHGGHQGMTGMMSDDEMARLGKASGKAFDQQFLTLMIAHHQGAVDMAATELRDGTNADAKALAQRITDAQNKEIGQMRGMLASG